METHPHSRDLPCVGLIRVLFVACLWIQSSPKHPFPVPVRLLSSLNTLIEHRYQSSKHGQFGLTIKHDKPKQHKIIVEPNLQIRIAKPVSDVDEISDSQDMRFGKAQTHMRRKTTPCYAQRLSVSHLLIRRLQTAQSPCCQFRPAWLA